MKGYDKTLKIKYTDYKLLERQIEHFILQPHKLEFVNARLLDYYYNHPRWFMWEIYHLTVSVPCKISFHKYMTDSHIQTAVKRILNTAEYKFPFIPLHDYKLGALIK